MQDRLLCLRVGAQEHEVGTKCIRALISYRRGLYHSIMYIYAWHTQSIQCSLEYCYCRTDIQKQCACQQNPTFGNLLSVPTERKKGVTKVQVMCCIRCAGHQRFLNILVASSRLYDPRGFKAPAICPYCCKVMTSANALISPACL